MKISTKISENQIQTSILEWIFAHPKLGYAYRTNNIPVYQDGRFRKLPRYTPRGIPDIHLVLWSGRMCYIEVKAPKKYQSKDQKEFQRHVEQHNAIYVVARSIDDVRDMLAPIVKNTSFRIGCS